MTETTALRSFVAVPLPAAVQAEIAGAARELSRELPGVKWSKKPENLHVTMKFLGPVSEERLATFGEALGEAVAGVPAFVLDIMGMGAFPSPRTAKVIFAGVDDEQHRLAALAEVVETVAERHGFSREARAFAGHVTFGRSKGGVDARAALASRAHLPLLTTAVEELHVYESQLGGEGSTYVLRRRARLGARAN